MNTNIRSIWLDEFFGWTNAKPPSRPNPRQASSKPPKGARLTACRDSSCFSHPNDVMWPSSYRFYASHQYHARYFWEWKIHEICKYRPILSLIDILLVSNKTHGRFQKPFAHLMIPSYQVQRSCINLWIQQFFEDCLTSDNTKSIYLLLYSFTIYM